ncbi:MAG: CHAT domain-containing protein [Elainellaceae cyanobacterium]
MSDIPCLSIAISRLEVSQNQHYALWALKAPFPGGYVHHDCAWTPSLTHVWKAWQSVFSPESASIEPVDSSIPYVALDEIDADVAQGTNYTSRLMQYLGVKLWSWLFEGSIRSSFDQSQGIAIGQCKPLQLRLDVRDPTLTHLPWEIMQAEAGMQAISLGQQLLFSRTTSAVDPLPLLRSEAALKILLVLGESSYGTSDRLDLQREAQVLEAVLTRDRTEDGQRFSPVVECKVDTLVQPTPAELVDQIEQGRYNILFYAGHGVSAPDGGLLFLGPNATINGTELAQVLTRNQVKLAVFNACWGAQPDRNSFQQPIPRSSLAEVLVHHGVPAVLAMRDTIADEEALSFIKSFAEALAERRSIDGAVAIARQQLLTLYKFNQPTWTLPVLYMHPDYNGELIRPFDSTVTEIPEHSSTWISRRAPSAFLRPFGVSSQIWPIHGGVMRIGKMEGNDMIIREPGVSRQHAEIFYRESAPEGSDKPLFYLRDFSRFGTWLLDGLDGTDWTLVHQREVPLRSSNQIKFGSTRSQALEFVVEK